MTLAQFGCSTSNPADGTALGAPAGFTNPVTASGTTRTWKTADAWRANTGIDFVTGGGTDALRTTAFTANATLAFTGVLRTPTANPSASLTVLSIRTAAGVGFRLQRTASGSFVILNTAGTAIVVPGAGAGAMATNTRYLIQTWFKQVAASASGTMKLAIYDLAGTLIGSYDSDTNGLVNLGSNPFVQLDFDQGGVASNYGWSEIQWDDGRASFIPAWSPVSSYTGALDLTGTGTSTAAGLPTLMAAVSFAGSGTLTATGSPAMSGTVASSGTGTLTTAGAPTGTAQVTLSGSGTLTSTGTPTTAGQASLAGSGALTAAGMPTITGRADLTGDGTLTISDTLSVTAQLDLTGSGTSTSTGTGTPTVSTTVDLTGAGVSAATGNARMTSMLVLSGAGTLTLQGGGSSSGVLLAQGDGTLTTTGTPCLSTSELSTGTGALTLAGTPTVRGTSVSTSSGTLKANGSAIAKAEAPSAGQGELAFIGAPILTALLLLTGDGLLTLLHTQAGHDITVTGTLGAGRWAGTATTTAKAGRLGPRRWGERT